jgi:polyisoprenoid-binding protein YceI
LLPWLAGWRAAIDQEAINMIRTFGFLAIVATLGFAQPPKILIQPESRVWVEGGSTVRGFTCTAAEVEGTVVSSSGATALTPDDLDAAVVSVEVRIPVAQLGCGNGTMDGHMKKALKASEHETIVFSLHSYSVSAPIDGTSTLELLGTLTMAGAELPIVVMAEATGESDGTLRVQGSQPITMSQWGVKPPSLMLGTMKVRDDVIVHFDIRLRQQ